MQNKSPKNFADQKFGYVDFSENREPFSEALLEEPSIETASEQKPQPQGVRVNGFAQVLDLLRAADPEFRESLLKRIALRDRTLATNLRRELKN